MAPHRSDRSARGYSLEIKDQGDACEVIDLLYCYIELDLYHCGHAVVTDEIVAARGVLCGPYSRSPCMLNQGGDRVVLSRTL